MNPTMPEKRLITKTETGGEIWRWVMVAQPPSDVPHVVGYCTGEAPAGHPHPERFHADGHVDAPGAAACYRGYEIDHAERHDSHRPCIVCKAPTQHRVRLSGAREVVICTTHDTREDLAQLIQARLR
jgi:hypothetical protein